MNTLSGPSRKHQWQAPDHWQKIQTIDLHTEGEPLRVVLGGYPELKGQTILEYRQYVLRHWDTLRTALMWEPRGHADMYGCLLTPPVSREADFGVLFMHNEGYSTMCGHAIIALASLACELRWVELRKPLTPVTIDTPAGQVKAFTRVADGKVQGAFFQNVPSFVVGLDFEADVPGMGTITYDLAFGGAFYAYVQAAPLSLGLAEQNFQELINKGMAIKRAVMEQNHQIRHPFEEDLSFLYGTIFIGPPAEGSKADSRNVCIFAEGEVDRSPTGTGVSGRMAIHHARGEIDLGASMVIESIIGSSFTGSVKELTRFGPYDAVIPQVEGKAYITGKHEFYLNPDDPLHKGFILR